jgi:hypothetical protein
MFLPGKSRSDNVALRLKRPSVYFHGALIFSVRNKTGLRLDLLRSLDFGVAIFLAFAHVNEEKAFRLFLGRIHRQRLHTSRRPPATRRVVLQLLPEDNPIAPRSAPMALQPSFHFGCDRSYLFDAAFDDITRENLADSFRSPCEDWINLFEFEDAT